MRTNDLIAKLSDENARVRRAAPHARLAVAGLAGFTAAAIGVALILTFQPGLPGIFLTFHMSTKLGFTLSVALLALVLLAPAARPEARPGSALWLLVLPFAAMAVAAGLEQVAADPQARMALWLGGSWNSCPVNILLFSLPVLASVLVVFRAFAPADLRAAGALAGFLAGGLSATAYALHCPESAMSFMASWYALGMAASACLGALLGPYALRW
jgi:hypothetical protein